MPDTQDLVIGVLLSLRPADSGGRQTPVHGSQFDYRPNWGLPQQARSLLANAPVLSLGVDDLHPGQSARAVIVPTAQEYWRNVKIGDELPAYEGNHLVGMGRVLVIDESPVHDTGRWEAWTHEVTTGIEQN